MTLLFRYRLLAFCFILPAITSGLYAQTSERAYSLPDSVVITASRLKEDVRLTGRRLTVLTARDIAMQPVSSVDELLRTVGGVEIHSRGGFGAQSDFTMRGSTFNGVLVLLDGARLNDPMTGHFLSDIPIPLSEIARIEILRGPATALYGPDAIGGVIQILTYGGLREAGQPESLSATLSAHAGQYSLYDVDAGAFRNGKRLGFGFATAWQGTDGMPITNAAGQAIRGAAGAVRTDFARQAHTASLTGRLGNVGVYARAGYDDREFGAFHYYTAFASDTAREATQTYWTQLRLQGPQDGRTQWQVQLAAKQHDDEYTYNPRTPANLHTSRLLYAQAHASRQVHPRLTLLAGAGTSWREIDSNNLGQHDDASAGAFVSARWLAFGGLTLNGSGRLDYDPGYGIEATPQLSAAYNTSVFTLRAGLSRAVREPNYVERYFNTMLARPRGRDLGNPDLKAETAWAYEAGLDVYPVSSVSFHATAFRRLTDNLIDYVQLTPQDTVYLARNILSADTRGVEVDGEVRRSLGETRITLGASYTWLDTELGEVAPGMKFKYVLTNARHIAQVYASSSVGPVSFGLQGLHKTRLTGEKYEVFNARAGLNFYLGRQRLTVTTEMRNLFDVQYADVFDAPMPGRWWLFGVRLSR